MKKRNAKVFALFMSVAMAMPNVAAAMPVYAAPEFEDEADFGDKFEEEFEAEAEKEVEAENTTEDESFEVETEDIEDVQAKKDDDNTGILDQGDCGDTAYSTAESVAWELRESGVLYLTADSYSRMATYEVGKRPWEAYKDKIVEVYVDGKLGNISASAFKGCANLEKVTLSKDIGRIEDNAFEDCTKLERVTYPDSSMANTYYYGKSAFRNCTSLKYLTFTEYLSNIEEFCFYNCKSLSFPAGLNLQGNLKRVEKGAFWGCSSLTKLILPSNVQVIAGGFDPEAGTSADAVSNKNTLEGKWGAFAGCTGLTSVEFKDNNDEGIASIGQFAFYGCTNLGVLTLPYTLTNIDEYAFEDCIGLGKVTMQDSKVTTLYGTFKRCRGLGSFVLIPTYNKDTKSYTANLNTIDKETFHSCTSLKTVDLAADADHADDAADTFYIGDDAFRDCTSLGAIDLPNDLNVLSDRSFQGCTALTTIVVPEGTTLIGKNAFYGDIKLDNIYLPKSLTFIDANAFGCRDDEYNTMRLMDVYYGYSWRNFGLDTTGNNLIWHANQNDYRYKSNAYSYTNIDLDVPQIKEVVYKEGGMNISWDKVTTQVGDKTVSPDYYRIYENHDQDNTIDEQWKQQTPYWRQVAKVSGSEDEFTYNIDDVLKEGDIYNYRIIAEYNPGRIGDADHYNSKLSDVVTYTVPVKDSDIIPVKSITFEDSSVTVKKDESQKIDLVIDPTNASSVNYVWTTEDEKVAVATVSDDKKSVTITGKSEGHTMISVSTPDGKLEASFIVYVVDPKTVLVNEITADKKEVSIEVDATEKVSITIKPEDATGKFEWTSENPTVATVKPADDEKSAQITGVKEGETKVTVNSNGVETTIVVKVVPKKEIPASKTPVVIEDANGNTTVYQNGKAVENYTGLAKLGTEEDAAWVYVEGGKRNQAYTGFVDYDGASFYVSGGTMDPAAEGLKLNAATDTWYYVGAGQVQNYTGLATYNGEWFYVENGKLNTTLNAFVEYDKHLFAVGAGRIISEYSGLMQDPQNTKTGDWYFFADGMAQTQYTGLVQYNGAWFYVQAGKFDPTYTGSVEYDGATFNVVNGQAVIQ